MLNDMQIRIQSYNQQIQNAKDLNNKIYKC